MLTPDAKYIFSKTCGRQIEIIERQIHFLLDPQDYAEQWVATYLWLFQQVSIVSTIFQQIPPPYFLLGSDSLTELIWRKTCQKLLFLSWSRLVAWNAWIICTRILSLRPIWDLVYCVSPTLHHCHELFNFCYNTSLWRSLALETLWDKRLGAGFECQCCWISHSKTL